MWQEADMYSVQANINTKVTVGRSLYERMFGEMIAMSMELETLAANSWSASRSFEIEAENNLDREVLILVQRCKSSSTGDEDYQ